MVDGPAYGAGAEIALCSDVVVASARSSFAFSGGRVGALCCISAGFGYQTTLGRKVVEMNLTGTPIKAEDAKSIGLVNYVEAPENLLARVNVIVNEMGHVSPISNASFKRIRKSLITRRVIDTAHKELLETITSSDFKKGAEAFAKKISPEYYAHES